MNTFVSTPNRRSFLAGVTGSILGALTSPAMLHAQAGTPVRFGLIADLHHSFMPKAELRLEAFLASAQARPLDFLIQIGDLCHGYTTALTPGQRELLHMWNSVGIPHYSVLGNHEMDSCSKQCIMDYLHMEKPYYSFDCRGVHFVVLDCMHVLSDGKYIDYDHGNYYRFHDPVINLVSPPELEWLRNDLERTHLPTIVFTHPCMHPYWASQSAINEGGVRKIFQEANASCGWQKVAACLSGHEHVDEHAAEDGIHYVLMNSASYYYVGDHYGSLAQYRDPLFCFITVDPKGTITIEGRDSIFVPPTPAELKFPDARHLSAKISNRRLHFRGDSAIA